MVSGTPPTFVLPLTLEHPTRPGRAVLALGWFAEPWSPPAGFLSAQEAEVEAGLTHERRRSAWLSGRWAAKQALAAASGTAHQHTVLPGVFDQPVVTGPGSLGVTISHAGALAGALAFPSTHPMGLDLESVRPEVTETVRHLFAGAELRPWVRAGFSSDQAHTLLWTAKEALGKALGTGLTTPLDLFRARCDVTEALGLSQFDNFPQYRVVSGLIGPWAFSVCHPVPSPVAVDFEALNRWYALLT